MKSKTSKYLSSNLFKFLFFCSIITIIVLVVVKASDLSFEFKEITIGGNTFNPMTDAMAFHFSVVDYDVKDGDTRENSLNGPLIESSNINVKWYGRYHMNSQYNIVNFIEHCHSKYPTDVENYCYDSSKDYDYSKVIASKGQIATGNLKAILNNFWTNMCSKSDFNILQDEFILKQYIMPAISKLNLTNSQYKKAFGVADHGFNLSVSDIEGENGKQLITALFTMIYSDFWTADLSNHTEADVKRGDLVPFLYNVDETQNDPYDIAKYAYIAYIYGFDTAGRTDGFHYWEQEFESVLENENYDLTDEEIEKYWQKYDKMASILSDEKGNKGSRLLGASINTIIKGQYNIETQVSAVRSKIHNILNGFEIETTYEELIAKNYLMVKHMMDNDHIKDTIKDYEIGTIFRNETSLSQGQVDEKNTNTALLSDFQLVTVSANNLLGGRTGDTDGDGVTDGDELGPEPNFFNPWTDITSVVKAALKLDATYDEIPVSKALKWETFNDSIKIEWEDASKTKVKKVLAKLYKYKSNPNLKDTDFDGLDDKEEKNKEPLRNNFKGSSMTTPDGTLSLDFNTDFRYLMHNDTKYNDELAQQSLIMSNLASGKTITLNQNNINYGSMGLKEYMEKLGFKNIEYKLAVKYLDGLLGSYGYNIGYKSIDYYNKKRGVIGIFISEFQDRASYEKIVVTDNIIRNNKYYEEIAETIYRNIDLTKLSDLSEGFELGYCYWISGKGIGGGIAAEVADYIRNEKNDNSDIYCYTFGSPKTHIGSKIDTDSFIKNIINEDDYLTKVLTEENAYRKGDEYNASINTDFRYNYRNLTRNSPKYTGDYMKVNSINEKIKEYKKKKLLSQNFIDDLAQYLNKKISRATYPANDFVISNQDTELKDIITAYESHSKNQEFETASSVGAYWTLSKCLEGLDKSGINGRKYEKRYEEAISEMWDYDKTDEDLEYEKNYAILLDAIKTIGEAYLKNVYTYHGANRYAYTGGDSIESQIAKEISNQNYDEFDVEDAIFNEKKKMKTSTITAYEKWNERKEQIYEKIYGQVKNNVVTNDEELTDEKEELINNLSKQTMKTIFTQMKAAEDNPTALHYLDTLDEYATHNKKNRRYNYDNTIDLGIANKESFVGDDCSCFATAVYWYYLNNISEAKDKTKIDLWTTGSSQFISNRYSHYILNILLSNDFHIYQWDVTGNKIKDEYNIYKLTDFELKPGDLLYRAQQNGKPAHVEFYLGEGKSFGWGEIHSSYENNTESKHFEIIRESISEYNRRNGLTRNAQNTSSGDKYKIDETCEPGIYNTVKAYIDNNCRYDYVIRLEKRVNTVEVVANE